MSTNAQSPAPKKRRFYHNYLDAYRVTSRTYPWIGWAMGGTAVVTMIAAIAIGVLYGGLIFTIISGILLSILFSMLFLIVLVRPAMYRQLDGTAGAAYSVVSQMKGWVVSEEPVQMTRERDIVWRIIGRAGVVLISEGPSSHVVPLMNTERKLVSRVVTNVPVTFVQVGHEKGQVPLAKLPGKLRGLKMHLTKEEVPAVASRLSAVGNKGMSLPRSVDPTNVRMNRRALRGK